ncbi:MAG: polysaccharide deacetylase family protein [Chloroflexi bacterium]|nr:polysaccharide deacetylase family protein [Chloroflexota bacterium]MBI3340946.1 polysaccharide deacetylase family protein [Chloroflexota bacterium]
MPASPLSRRDFLKLGGIALLATALGRVDLSQADTPPTPIFYHGSRRYPRIALTYDDIQLVTRLHMLENILDQNPEARITLFPVGNALATVEAKDPGIWKRFYGKGHEFGYHSYYHDNLAVYKPQQVVDDYDKWLDALAQVLGEQPTVHFARPPYDIISNPFMYMSGQRGLIPTLFSIGGGGPAAFVMNAIRKYQNGDIVQFHTREQPDSQDMTTTSQAIPFLNSRGVQCVTLSQLYDDVLRDQINATGCDAGAGQSLTRTCLEQ